MKGSEVMKKMPNAIEKVEQLARENERLKIKVENLEKENERLKAENEQLKQSK